MKIFVFVAFIVALFLALPQKTAAQGFECSMCEFVVNYIEEYIKENKTEAQIVQLLIQLCVYAPGSLKQQCITFITNETPALIQYIINTESPQTACTQLGICSSDMKIPPPPPKKPLSKAWTKK